MNKIVLNELKKTIIIVIVFVVAASALFVLTSCKSDNQKASEGGSDAIAGASSSENNSQSSTQQAMQTIIVTAKSGGYSPRKIEAKAGIPTILIMKSENAYGCERAFYIPDLSVGVTLPENGQTQFDLGVHTQGTKLVGVCGMGMYYFQIIFK